MEEKTALESEIKQWLEVALKAENLKEFSVKLVGNSEKGDGYLGDIAFVDVSGNTKDGLKKECSLVLKCSKRSEALRAKSPVREVFLNEIRMYEILMPALQQFEKDRGIENYFNSVPKYYGNYVDDSMEVIALENLKKNGYDLWNRKEPLTRKHINLVTSIYAQFHAISVAMNDQQPDKFKDLKQLLEILDKKFEGSTEQTVTLFEACVDEVYHLLENDLCEDILLKWLNLKKKVGPLFRGEMEDVFKLKVITHGDCWNNNFMYLCENGDKNVPKKVAILDWQMSRYTTPISDLSYFIFACVSEEDLQELDVILEHYYNSFANHLQKLGSQASKLYTYEQFLDEWKAFCNFGLMLSSLIHKICTTEKDEVVDIKEGAEQGKHFVETFSYEIKNKEGFRNRIRPIVKYVVEHDLI